MSILGKRAKRNVCIGYIAFIISATTAAVRSGSTIKKVYRQILCQYLTFKNTLCLLRWQEAFVFIFREKLNRG